MTKIAIFDLESKFWDRKSKLFTRNDGNVSIKYYYLFNSQPGTNNDQIQKVKYPYKIDADILIIYGYRIPDIILAQLSPATKVVYIQHGYYTTSMKRNFFSITRKIDRLVRYAQLFAYAYVKSTSINRTKMRKLLNFWIRGKDISQEYGSAPDLCLIMGEYWKMYHVKHLGWEKSKYEILPFYESKQIHKTETNVDYQYICQSLVEDGRISAQDLRTSLIEYFEENSVERVYFIEHPRTDRSIYIDLGIEIIFIKNCIFKLKTLGHYSSLLLYAKYHDLEIELVPLKNHTIPADFAFLANLDGSESSSYYNYTSDVEEAQILNRVIN